MTEDRKAWLEERRLGLGGSDSPVVLGVSPFKGPRKLALQKLGLEPEDDETPAMKRGKRMEEIAAELFMEKTGIELVTVNKALVHPDLPWWRANVDRTTLAGDTVAEIKVPGWRQVSKIQREGMSDYIQVQNQHYMIHPQFKRGIYIVMNIEAWDVIWFEQQPDAELQDIIIEKDTEFWNMIQAGEVPEEDGPVIDLPPALQSEIFRCSTSEWLHAVDELQEAIEIRKEAEELETSAKETIQTLMGQAQVAESEGFRAYWRYQDGRVTLDSKKMKKDFPALPWDKYEKKGQPFRTFKPYWLRGQRDE